MNKVQETLPNVVGGVSQQPPALRRPENCEEQINAVSSTVEGLVKRPPFEIVAGGSFPCSPSLEPFLHSYRRGADDIAIAVDGGRLFVSNLTAGTTEEAVIDPAAANYFKCSGHPADAFDAVTVQDTTFIVNKQIAAAISTAPSEATVPDAIVFWKGSGYGETFKLRIDRPDLGTFAEWSVRVNEPPTSGTPPLDPLKTNKMAELFAALLSGSGSLGGVTVVSSPGSASSLLGVTVEHDGSRIRLRAPAGAQMSVFVEDGQGGNFIKAVQDKVDKVSDLPAQGFDGFLIRIAGNLATIVDDYWVRWDGYVWLETVDPTCVDTPVSATMPHVVRPKVDGGWEAKPYAYAPRRCGDLVTNPSPSFVDGAITGLFFHRDRLGILTKDSIVQSETSEYGNFYRTTVTGVIAGDPIDVLESEPLFAAPFDRNLAVFCNTKQVIASAEGPWTASTMAMTDVSSFEMDRTVRPQLSGRSIFFASVNGGFSRVKRFTPLVDAAGGYDERDLCVHVPRYVPKNIRRMAVSEGDRRLVCVSRGAKSTMHIYEWLEDGPRLVQSSWSRWTSPLPVLDAFSSGSSVYLMVRHGSTARFLMCDLTPNRADAGLNHLVHLDLRFDEASLSRTYDPASGTTDVSMPVPVVAENEYRVVSRAGAEREGTVYPVISTSGNIVRVLGDASAEPLYVGSLYPETYQFSEFVMRDQDGLKRPIERVNVGLVDLELTNTGDLTVMIQIGGRPVRRIVFGSRLLGDEANLLDQTVLRSSTMRVPVRSRADRVKVSITSNSHLPTRMTGATWRGSYSDKQTVP